MAYEGEEIIETAENVFYSTGVIQTWTPGDHYKAGWNMGKFWALFENLQLSAEISLCPVR